MIARFESEFVSEEALNKNGISRKPMPKDNMSICSENRRVKRRPLFSPTFSSLRRTSSLTAFSAMIVLSSVAFLP